MNRKDSIRDYRGWVMTPITEKTVVAIPKGSYILARAMDDNVQETFDALEIEIDELLGMEKRIEVVPRSIETLASLREWVMENKPTLVIIEPSSPLKKIRELSDKGPYSWTLFRDIEIVRLLRDLPKL